MNSFIELLGDAEFWVAVAFVLFVGLMGYLGVHKTVAKSLDPGFSLLTVVVDVPDSLTEQVIKQLSKLINVVTVTHVSDSPAVVREMVLVKVSLPDEMRSHLLREAEIFRARVVDSAPGSFTLEATGDSEKLEAFLGVIAAYGRLEVARTGTVSVC